MKKLGYFGEDEVKLIHFAGEEVIMELEPDYEPIFSPIFEPASGEIESLLFALQAAIGSGVVFYCVGYMVGKHKKAD